MEIFALLGFIFAGYSVIANDSLQTLGTWISSNKSVKWYYQWIYASVILAGLLHLVVPHRCQRRQKLFGVEKSPAGS